MDIEKMKRDYNALLVRFRNGERYLENNYSAKAHDLLIGIGVKMENMKVEFEKMNIQFDAWEGFRN